MEVNCAGLLHNPLNIFQLFADPAQNCAAFFPRPAHTEHMSRTNSIWAKISSMHRWFIAADWETFNMNYYAIRIINVMIIITCIYLFWFIYIGGTTCTVVVYWRKLERNACMWCMSMYMCCKRCCLKNLLLICLLGGDSYKQRVVIWIQANRFVLRGKIAVSACHFRDRSALLMFSR